MTAIPRTEMAAQRCPYRARTSSTWPLPVARASRAVISCTTNRTGTMAKTGNSSAYPDSVPPLPAVMTLGASTSASITIQAGPTTRSQRVTLGARSAPAMERIPAMTVMPRTLIESMTDPESRVALSQVPLAPWRSAVRPHAPAVVAAGRSGGPHYHHRDRARRLAPILVVATPVVVVDEPPQAVVVRLAYVDRKSDCRNVLAADLHFDSGGGAQVEVPTRRHVKAVVGGDEDVISSVPRIRQGRRALRSGSMSRGPQQQRRHRDQHAAPHPPIGSNVDGLVESHEGIHEPGNQSHSLSLATGVARARIGPLRDTPGRLDRMAAPGRLLAGRWAFCGFIVS